MKGVADPLLLVETFREASDVEPLDRAPAHCLGRHADRSYRWGVLLKMVLLAFGRMQHQVTRRLSADTDGRWSKAQASTIP